MPNYFSKVPSILSTTADGVLFISTADIDSDGDLDILYAARRQDESGWYENLGNGVISTTPNIISTDANGVMTLASEDIDNDGDLDVLTASFSDDKIAWHENLGDGIFGTQNIISATVDGASDVKVADINGDGHLDVLSAAFFGGEITWYENDGNESFSERVVSTLADGARIVEVADLDNDGDLDILSASSYDDKIAWYENIGNGQFGSQKIIASGSGAFSLITADVDDDGDLDVVYTFRSVDTIAWSENLGDGNFSSPNIISQTSGEAFSLKVADVDIDGDLDLFASSFADDTFAWYENLGGGNFGTENIIATTLDGATDGATWMDVADLDNDGDLDLATASFYSDTIAWYENLTIPGPQITPPTGFEVTVFSAGLDYPNGMIALEDGSLLIGTSEADAASYFFSTPGQLLLLSDNDQDGVADEQVVVASDLPSTITHIKQAGDLIFVSSFSSGEGSEISIFRRSGFIGNLDEPFELEILGKLDFVFDNSTHAIVPLVLRESPVSGQYELFFSLGAEGNNFASVRPVILSSSDFGISETSLDADSIYRVRMDSSGEFLGFGSIDKIASGLRNAADFEFQESTGDLYFIENGIDGILTTEVSAQGGVADINEPLTADELNRITVDEIGGFIEDFGFSNEGTKYRTGELIDGQGNVVVNSEIYVDPLAVFQPLGGFSESEGPASLALAPSTFPGRFKEGVFIGFYGRGGRAGLENEENPVLFYDFTNEQYFQFISNDAPGIGHPITLTATDDALFVADISAHGKLRGSQGLGKGVIYKFTVVPDVTGTNGNDNLAGTGSGEFIFGYQGNDKLLGLSGKDVIDGGGGNDRLHGGDGADTLSGGNGKDLLRGEVGEDTIDGGGGKDLLDYVNSDEAVTVNLSSGTASGGHAAGDTFTNVENVRGSAFDDIITGDSASNTIIGRAGADVLNGGDGNDRLRGEAGADILDGGSGNDWADYSNSNAAVTVDLFAGTGVGGHADDDSLTNIERVRGSAFDDYLIGNAGSNVLLAGEGNDSLEGGLGRDTFRYTSPLFGMDTILDFEDGIDRISVRGSGLTFDSFTRSQQGANDTLLKLNSANSILLIGISVADITAADFLS